MLLYGDHEDSRDNVKIAVYYGVMQKLDKWENSKNDNLLLANYLSNVVDDEYIAIKTMLDSYINCLKTDNIYGEEKVRDSWFISSCKDYFENIISNNFSIRREFYFMPDTILGHSSKWKYSPYIHGIVLEKIGYNSNGMYMVRCEPEYIYRFSLSEVIPIDKIEVLDNRVVFDDITNTLYEIDLKVTPKKDEIIKYLRYKYGEGQILKNDDIKYCECWQRLNVVIYYDYDIKNNICSICIVDRAKWDARSVKLYGSEWL